MATSHTKPKTNKFGKLTLLSEFSQNGIRFAVVRCTCGVERTVPRYRLSSGQLKSCGARKCRVVLAPVALRSQHPLGPRGISWATMRGVMNDHEKGKLKIAQIADKYEVSIATVTNYARLARAYGGFDAYRDAVTAHQKKD